MRSRLSLKDCHACPLTALGVGRLYASYLYESDLGFARICLLIFAVASSYSDDTRVRSPRNNGGTYGREQQRRKLAQPLYHSLTLLGSVFYSAQSSGWVFYHAFTRLIRHRGAPTQLYDLQVAVVGPKLLHYRIMPFPKRSLTQVARHTLFSFSCSSSAGPLSRAPLPWQFQRDFNTLRFVAASSTTR